MKKLYLVIWIINLVVFVSCRVGMMYKPISNPLINSDSITVTISDGKFISNATPASNFHFYFYINNKSYLPVYIDKQSWKLTYNYAFKDIPFELNHFLDTVVDPHSKKEVFLSSEARDIFKDIDFSNDKILKEIKENRRFVMNVDFIVGDSIIKKEIIFMPE
jgi:hypothetical protein